MIQCNASNVHGYQFTGGYINVLGNDLSVFIIIIIIKSERHAAGPRVWNALPPELRHDISFGLFRRKLKSHLFV